MPVPATRMSTTPVHGWMISEIRQSGLQRYGSNQLRACPMGAATSGSER